MSHFKASASNKRRKMKISEQLVGLFDSTCMHTYIENVTSQ